MFPCSEAGRLLNGFFILANQLLIAWFFSTAVQIALMNQQLLRAIFGDRLMGSSYTEYKVGDDVLTNDENGDPRTATVKKILEKTYDDVEKAYDITYELEW